MYDRKRLRRALALAAEALSIAAGAATLAPTGAGAGGVSASSASTAAPQWGVYTAPGAKDVAGAGVYSAFTGVSTGRVLDFLPTSSWLEMTRNAWMLSPYTGTGYQLELSVPMLPDSTGVSLDDCAAGSYDATWISIATTLVSLGLQQTEIRPGWEFNGNWYKWSAGGHVASYIGCFQHMVTAMRSVAGQQLTFTWNPNLGGGAFPAEQAWPGAGYVDDISLDVYDTSWTVYPTPASMTTAAAETSAWAWIRKGDHGLNFWSAFAAAQGKPLAISEWALTARADGHGGNDDPIFVDGMFDFMLDPANHVAYANYFNVPLNHQITAPTAFPLSAARIKARMAGTAPVPAVTTSAAPRPVTTTTPAGGAKPTPTKTPATASVSAAPKVVRATSSTGASPTKLAAASMGVGGAFTGLWGR